MIWKFSQCKAFAYRKCLDYPEPQSEECARICGTFQQHSQYMTSHQKSHIDEAKLNRKALRKVRRKMKRDSLRAIWLHVKKLCKLL